MRRLCLACWLLTITFVSETSAQDVNEDGNFDCADMDLIGAAVVSQSQDLKFDFDHDNHVTYEDIDAALLLSGSVLGDANLDGKVDRRDLHRLGLSWQRSVTGVCNADFNYDGFVDASDKAWIGVNWQTGHLELDFTSAHVNLVKTPTGLDAWKTNSFVFAESGPFELVAIPQRAPDGLFATTIAIRTKDPMHRIVTFDNVEITGAVHQVFAPNFGRPDATPTGIDLDTRVLELERAGRWNQADSQLLFDPSMVGAGAGQGLYGVQETNDFSDPTGLQPVLDWSPELAGIGPTRAEWPTDAFFLDGPFQQNYVEFARIVTPASDSEGALLTLGILGGDSELNALPFDGIMGLDDPIEIPFFAQPCDFDSDGFCDLNDLERLNMAVSNGALNPDLNLDGSSPPLITVADVDAWHNLSSPTAGDTDYDGDVDSADLNNLARNWQVNAGRFGNRVVTSWEGADFNEDGTVDAADLNLLGQNWQFGVNSENAAVPEPSGMGSLLIGFCLMIKNLRRP